MSLPKWLEELKHCPDGPEHCAGCMKIPDLIQALSIAWEALENVRHGDTIMTTHQITSIAMRRIEEMGK